MPIRTQIGKTDCDADAPVQFKFDTRKRFGFSVSRNEKEEKVTKDILQTDSDAPC